MTPKSLVYIPWNVSFSYDNKTGEASFAIRADDVVVDSQLFVLHSFCFTVFSHCWKLLCPTFFKQVLGLHFQAFILNNDVTEPKEWHQTDMLKNAWFECSDLNIVWMQSCFIWGELVTLLSPVFGLVWYRAHAYPFEGWTQFSGWMSWWGHSEATYSYCKNENSYDQSIQ